MKKMETTNFDDIRPYTDAELPAAMQRIASHRFFPILAYYVYPGANIDDVRQKLLSFKTIRDFQLEVMRRVNEQVIQRSISHFTCNGLDRLKATASYLYVSNHRDIMLDASFWSMPCFCTALIRRRSLSAPT